MPERLAKAAREGRVLFRRTVEEFVVRRIISWRRNRGIGQSRLAARLGIPLTQLKDIETGRSGLRVGDALMLARAIGMPPAELFEGWEDLAGPVSWLRVTSHGQGMTLDTKEIRLIMNHRVIKNRDPAAAKALRSLAIAQARHLRQPRTAPD